MPNIKSQIKRLRKSEESRERNRPVKSSLKTAKKRFNAACGSGDLEEAELTYRSVARDFDKAVSKGVIHKNKAANEKSKMARALNEMK